MQRPLEYGSLAEVYASDVFVEDAGDGNVRMIFARRRGSVLVESVAVVMPQAHCPMSFLAHLRGVECVEASH